MESAEVSQPIHKPLHSQNKEQIKKHTNLSASNLALEWSALTALFNMFTVDLSILKPFSVFWVYLL